MSGNPPGEQIGEDCALNLSILAVQDRTDPTHERLDFIHFFVVPVPHVATLCRSPCNKHYRISGSTKTSAGIPGPSPATFAANLIGPKGTHPSILGRYQRIAHGYSRVSDFSTDVPEEGDSKAIFEREWADFSAAGKQHCVWP